MDDVDDRADTPDSTPPTEGEARTTERTYTPPVYIYTAHHTCAHDIIGTMLAEQIPSPLLRSKTQQALARAIAERSAPHTDELNKY